LVAPDLSYGGNKLQNQLEQVLMMKSGEFSADGGTAHRQDAFLQNSTGSMIDGQNSSGILVVPNGRSNMMQPSPQTYGNPNFVPPQAHYPNSFNRDGGYAHQRARGQGHPVQDPRGNEYYQQQYPATFQHYEPYHGSSQKNFATSQFAGEPNQPHSKTNSLSGHKGQPHPDMGRQGGANNFTLQRNPAQAPEGGY